MMMRMSEGKERSNMLSERPSLSNPVFAFIAKRLLINLHPDRLPDTFLRPPPRIHPITHSYYTIRHAQGCAHITGRRWFVLSVPFITVATNSISQRVSARVLSSLRSSRRISYTMYVSIPSFTLFFLPTLHHFHRYSMSSRRSPYLPRSHP